MWVRDADLEPDWLRVGTDIVGGTTFNASFSLFGEAEAIACLSCIGRYLTFCKRKRPRALERRASR